MTAELQTANAARFQRKIQLPGFSAYPDGSTFQLIRVSGVLLYLQFECSGTALQETQCVII